MSYVDGFVIPVPKTKVAEYKKMATWGKKIWMKHGALQYFECEGDDLAGMPECGTFKKLAGLKPSETVFFSFIVYKNSIGDPVASPIRIWICNSKDMASRS